MNLLVAAGTKYIESVMAELNNHFQPGVLPHFFVVQTLGKLASANRKCGSLHYVTMLKRLDV